MDKWDLSKHIPIFGYVPEQYRDRYLRDSGTVFRNGRWMVDGDRILEKGEKPINNFLVADRFQNDLIALKKRINDELEPLNVEWRGIDLILHAYELMYERSTTIPYKSEGQDFVKVISLK